MEVIQMINDGISSGWIVILIIIFILGLLTWFPVEKIRRSRRYKAFLKVFGEVAAKHEDIILSIPLWKVKSNPSGDPRFIKQTFNVPKDEMTLAYGPEDTVAFSDLAGCIEINSFISSFHPKPLTFKLDTSDPLKTISANKTIFIIGSPIANLLAREAIETAKGEEEPPDPSLSSQSYLKYIAQKESSERGVGTIIWDVQNDRLYDSDRDWEYSMILRILNDTKDGYLFFIGGPHAPGTLAAAKFLKTNWKLFKGANQQIAGLLLRTRRDPYETGKYADSAQIDKMYGFPKKLTEQYL